MARRGRAKQYRRVELRFAADDALLLELAEEAMQRGVELQHHLYDLLRGRYLLRHGQSLHNLLWLPQMSEATGEEPPASPPSGGSAAADAWLALLDSDE